MKRLSLIVVLFLLLSENLFAIRPEYDIIGAGERPQPITVPTNTIPQNFSVADAVRLSAQQARQQVNVQQRTVTRTRTRLFGRR